MLGTMHAVLHGCIMALDAALTKPSPPSLRPELDVAFLFAVCECVCPLKTGVMKFNP